MPIIGAPAETGLPTPGRVLHTTGCTMPFSLLSRRDLLCAGGLAIAGAILPGLRGAAASRPTRARSVLLLNMMGGLTHLDSFDPKPEAPEEIRGTLATVQTTLPGIRFTEVMPGLARLT